MIGDLTARYLERFHPHLVQQIGAAMVEWRRKKRDAPFAAMLLDGAKRIIGQFELPDHVELRFGCTCVLHLIVGLRRKRRHNLFRFEGLKLDYVGASLGRSIDQLQRHCKTAVVIDTRLRQSLGRVGRGRPHAFR